MPKLKETFVKDFYHQWKNLRKSDSRLSREYGLTINEVGVIKRHLMNNPYLPDLDEKDDTTRGDEPKKEVKRPGALTRSIEIVTGGAAKFGKEVFNKFSGLVFEEPGRRMKKSEIAQHADESKKDKGHGDMATLSPGRPVAKDTVKNSTYDNGEADQFHEKQDAMEKAEFEQEVERRYAAKVGPILHDSLEKAEAETPRAGRRTDEKKEASGWGFRRQSKAEQDEDSENIMVFATALDRVMFKQAINKLLHERKELRIRGIVEVERIAERNRQAVRAIAPLAQDNDADVRSQALISLINLDSRENTDLFSISLSDENLRVRLAAIRGLLKFYGKDSGQFLVHALNDESADVRETIARHIAASGDTQAISELIEHLGRERDPVVRIALLQTLTLVCDKSTIACFISILYDSDAAVRRLAVKTLEKWTGENFGYIADAPREKREPAIQQFRQWWSGAKDTFQFRAQEPKIKKTAVYGTAPSFPVQLENRRKETVLSGASAVPARKKEILKESVPLHAGAGAQTHKKPHYTEPAVKAEVFKESVPLHADVSAPTDKKSHNTVHTRKSGVVRLDFNALSTT